MVIVIRVNPPRLRGTIENRTYGTDKKYNKYIYEAFPYSYKQCLAPFKTMVPRISIILSAQASLTRHCSTAITLSGDRHCCLIYLGGKPLKFQLILSQSGTAVVLKGSKQLL